MSINKKIFCLLVILIFCLGVSSVSAADINSDIVASEDTAIDSEIIGEASFDENLGAESTFVVTNSTSSNYFTDGELNDNADADSALGIQGTFTDDATLNAGESDSVYGNSTGDNIVTKDNFYNFFDENGNYIRNFTELTFKGDFDSLVDAITINQTLSIGGSDASLKNIAFVLLADGITLNNLELNFNKAPVLNNGSAILINAPNVSISDIKMDYIINESANTYAIYAVNADDLSIEDNEITFDVTNNGSVINNVIYVSDSSNVLVNRNTIYATIPSCYVNWKPSSSGKWVKAPIS